MVGEGVEALVGVLGCRLEGEGARAQEPLQGEEETSN